jgi:hypothetical protein
MLSHHIRINKVSAHFTRLCFDRQVKKKAYRTNSKPHNPQSPPEVSPSVSEGASRRPGIDEHIVCASGASTIVPLPALESKRAEFITSVYERRH